MKTLDKALVYKVTNADIDVADIFASEHDAMEEDLKYALGADKDELTFKRTLQGSELSKRLHVLAGKFPNRGLHIDLATYGAWFLELRELETQFEAYLTELEKLLPDIQTGRILHTYVPRFRKEFKAFLEHAEAMMMVAFEKTEFTSLND